MSEVPAAPAAAAPVTPAAAPAPAAQVAAPEAVPPAEPPKPERTFSQAELDEIVEKRLAKERRKREELKQERDVLRKLALERGDAAPKPAEPAKPQSQGEPVRDQFATYEEFIEARAEYRATQAVEKKMKEREDADRQRSAQEKQQKAGEDFRKAMKESAKDIADFEEVVSNITADSPVANLNADLLYAADNPGKMLHHLATHPEEAERIASLPLGKQAREIVELEKKLAAPPVKPSKAPEPIKPVNGGKTANADEMPDPSKNDGKDWLKWRERQISAKAKSGARA